MRTGLLAVHKRTSGGGLRAELTLAGRSVLDWQAELLRSLGCERIICLCEAPTAAMLDIQQSIEARGGEFHTARSSLQLVALMRTDDQVVILQDGLLVDETRVSELLLDGKSLRKKIVALSPSQRVSEAEDGDFERIDAKRRWAGIAVLGAAQVHMLSELPPDGDPVSSLLRLGLQAGIEVTDSTFETGKLFIASEPGALTKLEQDMIAGYAHAVPWSAPSGALVSRIVPRMALNVGRETQLLSGVGSLAAMLCGAMLAGLGYAAAGLGVAALGAAGADFFRSMASMRAKLQRTGSPLYAGKTGALIDIFATLALVAALYSAGEPLAIHSLPLFALGISRLHGINGASPATAFWQDRALHMAALAICAGFGVLPEGLAVIGLWALAQLLLHSREN